MADDSVKIQAVTRQLLKIRKTLSAMLLRLVKRYKSGWKKRVAKKRGWLREAIDFRELLNETDFREILLSTDKDPRVTYSDVFERGRTDGANYSGRYALGLTLEEEHARMDAEIDKAITDALGK